MTHPSDIELAAWVDEPETADASLSRHVAGCEICRDTVTEIESLRAALAADPSLPSADDFAAQRARIAAVTLAERPGGGRIAGRLGWLVPLAAAAAIAAVVLLGRGGPEAPPTADSAGAPETAAAIPLVADANAAAELVATAIVPESGAVVVPSETIDVDLLDAALAAADPLAPPVAVEASRTTQSRFAELAEEDQDAVLVELASADFDL